MFLVAIAIWLLVIVITYVVLTQMEIAKDYELIPEPQGNPSEELAKIPKNITYREFLIYLDDSAVLQNDPQLRTWDFYVQFISK